MVTGWRTAVDFRLTYPSNDLWSQTYTSWTRQNKKIWDARYGFYLVHGFDTRTLRDGTYLVQVKATDVRGNSGTGSFPSRWPTTYESRIAENGGPARGGSSPPWRPANVYPAGVAHERQWRGIA